MRAAPEITSAPQSEAGSGLRASGAGCVARDADPAARCDGRDGSPGGTAAGNRETADCSCAAVCAVASGKPRTCERRFPGLPEQVAQVRAFLADELASCPARADVILLTDELACNAVRHSDSRQPCGEFSVRAEICHGQSVRVEVTDAGGPWGGSGSEDDTWLGGRGLFIVEALASSWGVAGGDTGRTVWFITGWDAK